MKIFETFEGSGQNLSNSLCQFLNDKWIPLQILYPPSVSWKITPLWFIRSSSIYSAEKEPIKEETFETFKCSGQKLWNFLSQFWKDKSIPPQVLYPSSVSWNITPVYFLSTNNIHFLRIKSPLKWKSLRLSRAQVKICQIPYANSETTSRFLSKFCIPLQLHEIFFLCTFLTQAIYTLLIKTSLKWKAQVKICQIPFVNFKTTSGFLSKLFIPLQFHER